VGCQEKGRPGKDGVPEPAGKPKTGVVALRGRTSSEPGTELVGKLIPRSAMWGGQGKGEKLDAEFPRVLGMGCCTR